MKRFFLWLSVIAICLMISSPASAEEVTALSKKASKLKMYSSREAVIRLLGPATWASIQGDSGDFALPDPRISLELRWRNPGCMPVVVQFNLNLKATGWDEGRAFCGKDAKLFEPSDDYSCNKKDRSKFCK